MNASKTLPVELWLIILETALDPMNDASGSCSHYTFPEIHLRLLSPWKYVPMNSMDLSRQNLRLVCRTFNHLVPSSSQSVLLISKNVTPIPPKTLSVCISSALDPAVGLSRLLGEPGACSRISTLVMPLRLINRPGRIMDFDLLCDNGSSLPSMRKLSLVLHSWMGTEVVGDLWSRVNTSFPLLTCLAVGSRIHWEYEYEYALIIFKKLEILDVSSLARAPGVRFPLLRHAAVQSFTEYELEIFEKSRFLESILIRRIPSLRRGINWTSFKKLRLLGLPLKAIPLIVSFPPNHPLELLYVYTNPWEGTLEPDVVVQMVKKMAVCLPTVTNIHVDIGVLRKSWQNLLERRLKASGLKEWGLHVRPLHSTSHQLVFERIPGDSEPEPQLESVTLAGALKRGLGKLTQFGFRGQGS